MTETESNEPDEFYVDEEADFTPTSDKLVDDILATEEELLLDAEEETV